MASMDHLVQVVKANIWQLTFFLMFDSSSIAMNQAVGSIQWTNTFDFKILKYVY